MSQEVVCRARLDMPQLLGDTISQIAATNPDHAEWLKKFHEKRLPFTREKVEKTIARMIRDKGFRLVKGIDGYGEVRSHRGETLGVLKGNGINRGIAIVLDSSGKLELFAYDMESSSSVSMFEENFKDIFFQESIKSILFIFGYQLEEEYISETKDGSMDISVVMVKNPIGGGE